MPITIPPRDLRNHYGQIIERVRNGEQITVVADGEPVVDFVPHTPTNQPPRCRAANDRPQWAPLTAPEAGEWLTDIHADAGTSMPC